MAERARAAGGTLAIESAPGAGTTVSLEVPA
jgi:signal transduction histidine kinase